MALEGAMEEVLLELEPDPDPSRCESHGFALAADGTCIRCLREAQGQRRRQARRLVLAGLAASAVLGVIGVARAHMMRVANTPAAAPAPGPPAPETPSLASEVDAIVHAPVPRVSDAWSASLAQLDAERAAEAARREAAQRQAQGYPLLAPTVAPYEQPRPAAAPPPAPAAVPRLTRFYTRGPRGGGLLEGPYFSQNVGGGSPRATFAAGTHGGASTLRMGLGR
jgi:hypothetical protein